MKLSTYEITITVAKVVDMDKDLSEELEDEVRDALRDRLLAWGEETIKARRIDTGEGKDGE